MKYESYLRELLGRVHPHNFTVGSNAPETYGGLKQIGHMYVYGGASEQTIYGAPSDNHRFRAWHDTIHLALDQDFYPAGEAVVAREHARILGQWSAIAADLVYADVYHQVEYAKAHGGEFPVDQKSFINSIVFGKGGVNDVC